MDKTDSRQEIIAIINSLPEFEIPIILDYIKAIQKGFEEQTRILKSELKYAYMCSLPEDEELELTTEELANMERNRQAVKEGRFVKWEDIEEEIMS